MRLLALSCASMLLFTGCYTGLGRARDYSERVKSGMTPEEVRRELGAPDRIVGTDFPVLDQPILTWVYEYHTPFYAYIVPTILLFTIILTYPAIFLMIGLGKSGVGRISIEFGVDGRAYKLECLWGNNF